MTLSIFELFKRYSELKWYRKIYIKRYDPVLDIFENEWSDISNYLIADSVSSINRQLPQDNYSFGTVTLDNCNIELKNIYGELSDEDNANSVFKGYQRHNSKLKVVEGYIDDKTDPDNQVEVEAIVFEGLIDDLQAETTAEHTEQFIAKDKLVVLERYTLSDLGTISSTTVNTIVYELLNRDIFTKYFTVSNSSTYISAGYNTSAIDMTAYSGSETILTILNDLALGHSIFYIDSSNDTFCFLAVTPTPTIQYEFKDILSKRISLDHFMTGADSVIEDWYWTNTPLSSISASHKYYTSHSIDIKCITDNTQRQNLLDYIKSINNTKKMHFTVVMPYFPIIKLLDRVSFQYDGVIPEDAFILGVGRLGIDKLRSAIGAIKLNISQEFYIRGIKHSKQKTEFTVKAL